MKLKRLLKNKYLFENGIEITLSSEIINKYSLRKREELTQEEYLEVLELAALSLSYYYLEKRDYSEKELYLKLIQKYREKIVIVKVINILKEKKYLDDFSFAENFIKIKKYSKKRMEYELKLKGISEKTINEIFLSYSFDNEYEEVKKQLKKLGNKETNKKIASLMRKGYRYEDIRRALQEEKEGEEC